MNAPVPADEVRRMLKDREDEIELLKGDRDDWQRCCVATVKRENRLRAKIAKARRILRDDSLNVTRRRVDAYSALDTRKP